MAHPKHKLSKQRRDKRRTHDHAAVPTLSVCPNCGSALSAATTAVVRSSSRALSNLAPEPSCCPRGLIVQRIERKFPKL